MSQMTMTVRLSGALSDFVSENVESGTYENISEYVRSLIRNDKEQSERVAFERLKAELTHSFSKPESSFLELNAQEIFDRNR